MMCVVIHTLQESLQLAAIKKLQPEMRHYLRPIFIHERTLLVR